MRCPFCKLTRDRVIDSRLSGEGLAIRRRRQCLGCKRRFTTYERVDEIPLRLVKKDGSRVPFDRHKILSGLMKACEKRPIPQQRLEEIVNRIEVAVADHKGGELSTRFIGELVMKALRDLDEIAYVRFASVYREFKDVTEFMAELQPMIKG